MKRRNAFKKLQIHIHGTGFIVFGLGFQGVLFVKDLNICVINGGCLNRRRRKYIMLLENICTDVE